MFEIKNSRNLTDVVTVEGADSKHKGPVVRGLGNTQGTTRHANLTPDEARMAAYALLLYAEQQRLVDCGAF